MGGLDDYLVCGSSFSSLCLASPSSPSPSWRFVVVQRLLADHGLSPFSSSPVALSALDDHLLVPDLFVLPAVRPEFACTGPTSRTYQKTVLNETS